MIVAGFGFRASASIDSLLDAYEQATCEQAAYAVATLSDKADSAVFSELAKRLSLPIHSINPEQTVDADVETDSLHSRSARGTGSVAEASALAAVGTGAKLVQTRVISQDRLATCALAKSCTQGDAS